MKQIMVLWIGVIALAGCYDSGNYLYEDADKVAGVKISGLDEECTAVAMEVLKLDPVVEGIKDDAAYEYSWYVYKPDMSENQVIGSEKNLNSVIGLKNGDYTLVYQVKNRQSGVSAYQKMKMTVVSKFALGWYVTKDWENVTDVDMVKDDSTVYENMLKTIHGRGLSGEAVGTTYRSGFYSHPIENPDGTVTVMNGAALFIQSKEDMGIYSGDNLQLYKGFNDVFFDAPAVKRLQNAKHSYEYAYIVNNGKVHDLFSITSRLGKFSYEKLGDYMVGDQIFWGANAGPLFWDEKNSRFVMTPRMVTDIATIEYDPEKDPFDVNHLNCDLVFMKEQNLVPALGYGIKGFAVFKNKDKEEYYTAKVNEKYSGRKNPLTDLDTLDAGKELGKGKVFGVHNKNSYIYFSKGDNFLYSHNIVNHSEESYEFPAGESVAFIENTIAGQNCLVVVTNKDGKWKLYCFLFVGETGELQTPEWKGFSGNGNARAAMYRDPGKTFVN